MEYIKEWNILKNEIAWWNEDTSTHPIVTVICPHCGAKNTHNLKNYVGLNLITRHRSCDLM